MAKRNFWHMAINGDKKKDIDEIRKQIEELGVISPTHDEVMAVLLEKHKLYILPKDKIKNIIMKLRGIF